MKIRKPTTRLVDIGPLDYAEMLPTAPRKKHGMKTTCARCGEQVEDEMFVVGFKAGIKNILFHLGCLDEQTRALLGQSKS